MDQRKQQPAAKLAASAFLEALADNGVGYVFGNAGTDFAPLIEAYARAGTTGDKVPEPITVPHENVAVCMAQGVYLATGRPQAVILHVNVGTANAICGLINAARERIPVFLAAGRTPIMEEGMFGGRSAFIHWGQEMFDQGSMVREIVKWDYEIRQPQQVGLVVDRALAVAMSEPKGPTYVTLPREILSCEQTGDFQRVRRKPPEAPVPAAKSLEEARALLQAAERPLLVCSSIGKNDGECDALRRFAENQAVGVVPYRTRVFALPTDHPCNLGYEVGAHISDADLIIVAEADVPWIPVNHQLAPDAKVIHFGVDPEFGRYPMRNFRSDLSLCGNAAATLDALADTPISDATAGRRQDHLQNRRKAHLAAGERTRFPEPGEPSNTAWIARCLGAVQKPSDRVVVEIPFPIAHMNFTEPGSYFQTPSAGGLGWAMGASLGLKLADRNRRVVAIVGDGSYMFGNPTPAHLVSRALDIPTLTIIINNRMWAAVRRATLGLFPEGAAAATNTAALTYLDPSPEYEKIVEASGGYGEKVEAAGDLPAALERALHAVDVEKRPAVLNVITAYSDDEAKKDARK